MSVDFEGLAKEVLADLKATGEAFWDKLGEEQKPIVEQAGKDLAKYTLKLVTDPGNAESHKGFIVAIKATLTIEANLVALQATERLKDALQGALKKLVGVGLALL